MPPRNSRHSHNKLSDKEAKALYEKMMSGGKVNFDSVFDPVKARKEQVINKQRASVGLTSSTVTDDGTTVEPRFKTASAEEAKEIKPSGNKLKEIPALLKKLKGSSFTDRIEGTKRLALLTKYTTVDEDTLLIGNGFMDLMVAAAENGSGEEESAALAAILHMTVGKDGTQKVSEFPAFVGSLATKAADGDETAKDIVNHLAASRQNRDVIMGIPDGKGIHLIKELVDTQKPRFKKLE